MTDMERRDDDMENEGDGFATEHEDDLGVEASPASDDVGVESDLDFGPGSDDYEQTADQLMPSPAGPPQTVPGDFKENWSLLFCCIALFIAAMWLPMEGTVLDLTAKDSVAGGFLLVFSGYGMVACWANIQYRKMMMKPVLYAGFVGLYVAAKRLFLLFTTRLDEWKELASQEGGKELTKDDYLHLVGAGTWVILLFSLGIFWTLVQSARAGHARDVERKEAARAAKQASRSR